MNLGELVKTKTFWGGMSAIVTGVIMITQGAVDAGIASVFAGLQTIFVRDALVTAAAAARATNAAAASSDHSRKA